MKVFPNKDDSLASGLGVKQTRLLSPSSNPSPSAWWTWQMQTGSLSQMEPHEFTHDFMWKHTDFKWCRRQSHRGEICLPLSSQVLLQLKSHIFHIYIIIFSPKVSSLDKCMSKFNLENQIMTQTIQWKIKDSKLIQCSGIASWMCVTQPSSKRWVYSLPHSLSPVLES